MAQKKYIVRQGYVAHLSKGRILRGGNVVLLDESEIANQSWKFEEVTCELEAEAKKSQDTEKVNMDKGMVAPPNSKVIVRSKK